jgi:very-short-patch-repair endonuclease
LGEKVLTHKNSEILKRRWKEHREEMLKYAQMATEASPMTKKGNKKSKEHKQNISKAKKGKKFSEEHKQHLSESWEYDKHITPEFREKSRINGLEFQNCVKWSHKNKGKSIYEIYGEEKANKIMKANRCHEHISSLEKKLQENLLKKGIVCDNQFMVSKLCCIDLVPKNTKIAIFADGDYWHNLPKAIIRDKRHNQELQKQGWTVLRFWEHEINQNLDFCIDEILEQYNDLKEIYQYNGQFKLFATVSPIRDLGG